MVAPELGCELCILEQAGITVLVGVAVPERVIIVLTVEAPPSAQVGIGEAEPELGCVLEQAGITVLEREAVPERVTVVYTVDEPPSAQVGIGEAELEPVGTLEPEGTTTVEEPDSCELGDFGEGDSDSVVLPEPAGTGAVCDSVAEPEPEPVIELQIVDTVSQTEELPREPEPELGTVVVADSAGSLPELGTFEDGVEEDSLVLPEPAGIGTTGGIPFDEDPLGLLGELGERSPEPFESLPPWGWFEPLPP